MRNITRPRKRSMRRPCRLREDRPAVIITFSVIPCCPRNRVRISHPSGEYPISKRSTTSAS